MTTADEQHQLALSLLRPYASGLAGFAAQQEPVTFVASTWKSWFVGTEALDDVLAVLGGRSALRRAELAELATRADSAPGRRQLLLATLAWGRGKSNGRMRDGIVRLVTDPALDVVLARTQEHALAGEAAEGYAGWQLSGIGPAFFTKWLWAASLPSPPAKRLLILDSRVWATLNDVLGWSSIVAAGVRRRPIRYAAYVDAVHRWAEELSQATLTVTAEDLECAMFHAQGQAERLPR